jgi:NADH:ubiquinone oxidoreductase subunit E
VGACGLAPVVIIDGEVFGSANQSSKVMDTIVSIKLKEGM